MVQTGPNELVPVAIQPKVAKPSAKLQLAHNIGLYSPAACSILLMALDSLVHGATL